MLSEQFESRWLKRGHQFFRTMARNGVVRGALLDRGLTNQELQRGWDLFATAVGFARGAPDTGAAALDAAKALEHIEAWDGPSYASAQATLEHRTPAACAFLMHGLVAGTGPDAVVGVRLFVDRATALREGTVSGVPAAQSAEAVRLLAERKILDESVERQLMAWIALAQQGATPQVMPNAESDMAFMAYRNWLNEWREIARATITQRRHLIALGLATRRERDESAQPTVVEPAPVSVH